jgi:hypothetical protein
MSLDLRVGIYWAVEGPQAPEGPGWYLFATKSVVQLANPGQDMVAVEEIIPRVRISMDEMGKIARVLDNFTKEKPLNYSDGPGFVRSEDSLESAVAKANDVARAEVQRRLEAAEALMREIQQLRARAAEFKVEQPEQT